jgi:thymidylate kinase
MPIFNNEEYEEIIKRRPTLFLFVEGADGVGKTSYITKLADTLSNKGYKVKVSSIMAYTVESVDFKIKYTRGDYTPFQAALGMLHHTVTNLDLMYRNSYYYDVVLVDRSQASFYAYNLAFEENQTLLAPFENSLNADIYKANRFNTIYLICDPRVALKRISKTRALDSIETQGTSLQNKVTDRYKEFYAIYPKLEPSLLINTSSNSADQLVIDSLSKVERFIEYARNSTNT